MPRWKTEPTIEGNKLIELKRIIHFGNGYALVLPKDWVRTYCGSDNKVEVSVENDTITIKGYKGGLS